MIKKILADNAEVAKIIGDVRTVSCSSKKPTALEVAIYQATHNINGIEPEFQPTYLRRMNKKINQITRKELGNPLFDIIIDDKYDTSHKDHRRGSSFYQQNIYMIDQDLLKVLRESLGPNPLKEELDELSDDLVGFWESNTYLSDENWSNTDEIKVLTRVEKKTRTVTISEWVTV